TYPTEVTVVANEVAEAAGVPLVFSMVLVEGTDLVESVREPGGNATGVRYLGPEFALKRYEVMRQAVPDAKRYLIAYQEGYPTAADQVALLTNEAAKEDIEIVSIAAKDIADLKVQLETMEEGG